MRTETTLDTLSALTVPDSGFTLDAITLEPVEGGYAVALADSDRLIDAPALPAAMKRLWEMYGERVGAALTTQVPQGARACVGGWHNPEDSKIEVNVTAVFADFDAAYLFAVENDQIAMMDLDSFEVIATGGTGGARETEN